MGIFNGFFKNLSISLEEIEQDDTITKKYPGMKIGCDLNEGDHFGGFEIIMGSRRNSTMVALEET